jgi:DNA-directed RNA polymerase specialized sigma54-like protein
MVSVLALNKLELKEMINAEMVENPVLEEVEESAVTIEEMAGREAERERSAEEVATSPSGSGRTPRTPSTRSTLAATFRTIWILGFALRPASRSTTGLRSRTFCRSRVR